MTFVLPLFAPLRVVWHAVVPGLNGEAGNLDAEEQATRHADEDDHDVRHGPPPRAEKRAA